MTRLVLLLWLVHLAISLQTKRAYVMQRDYFSGIKAGEFSIYHQQTNALLYRIESLLFKLGRVELIAYPSKKVVGKLMIKWKNKWRDVSFEAFDNQTQQWKVGKFIQNYIGWYKDGIDIHWDGSPLNCEIDRNRLDGRFLTDNNTTVAKFKRGAWSYSGVGKYEVDIYSDDIPDSVYLLYIANFDEIVTRRKSRGK